MAQHFTPSSNIEVYFDLEGKTINGSTIPADIVTTNSRPDLVVINRGVSPTKVYLYELTVSYERNLEGANEHKRNKYAPLVDDIEENGYKCFCVCFEIGSRGYINNRNKLALGGLLKLTNSNTKFTNFYKNISKISLLCSFSIFLARNEPEWISPRYLTPVLKHWQTFTSE